MDMIDD